MTVCEAQSVSPGGEAGVNHRRPEAPLVVFAGGGTGGHLYPALAIAAALRARIPHVELVFYGTDRAIDAQVLTGAGETLIPQQVKPMTVKPWRWPAFVTAWRAATRQCREHFSQRRPAIVVGTGGFASAPAVKVAADMGIPTALLNPDVVPGRANRFLAARVTCVFAQWEESARYFPRGVRMEAAGCPVRAAFAKSPRERGHEEFALSPNLKTLLVTGASLGARSINEAFMCLAPELAALDAWQVFHVTGAADLARVVSAYDRAGVGAVCVPYTDRMAEVMAVADLVVSRAGASTVAEIAALGKPSILLPYPYHRDMHQLVNAEALSSRGAAVICRDWKDGPRTAAGMRDDLFGLLSDPAKLDAMGHAAKSAGRPDAAQRIAQCMSGMMGKNAESTCG